MRPLRPNELEIIPAGSDDVQLTFSADNGESVQLILSRKWLPTLMARLAKETAPGQAVPIDRDSLQIGANYSLQGYQVQKRADGARRLVLAIDLLDQGRVVTIPIEMSPEEVQAIMKMLS